MIEFRPKKSFDTMHALMCINPSFAALWPLCKGSIVIEKIVFEDLVINLENYSKEEPNWVFNKEKKEDNIQLEGNDFNNTFQNTIILNILK